MALIECKECGKNVSTKATSCPSCGAPVEIFLHVPELPRKPKPRLWLGLFLFFALGFTTVVPGLTFSVGTGLAAVILLHLYFAPLSRVLGNFLRVTSDRPKWRVLKLTGLGIVAALLITSSLAEYSTQRTRAQLELKMAAEDTARAKVVEAANAQVSRIIENAKAALAAGDVAKAEQALNEASQVKRARNLALVEKLGKTIGDSVDSMKALNLLVELPETDFAAFKAKGILPQSFSLGYASLTDRMTATAKLQLDTATVKRAELAAAKAAERKMNEEKVAALKAAELIRLKEKDDRIKQSMVSITARSDEVESITWYRHNLSPDSNMSKALWPYIGKKGNEVWLRMKITYTASDWLFINQFTFNIDGNNYPVSLDWGDRKSDNSGGQIWEWVDLMVNAQGYALLTKIRDSTRTILRYQGSQYSSDRDISVSEKQAIREILIAYEAMGGIPPRR